MIDKELLRNGSGYVDPTAYEALTNLKGEDEKMEFKRGDVVLFENTAGFQRKSLIVSEDSRGGDKYLSHIMLMERAQYEGNVVPITCVDGVYYAMCNMVTYAKSEQFGAFHKKATEAEMAQIDAALANALGISREITAEKVVEQVKEIKVPAMDNLEELMAAKAEAKVYKELYDNLLGRVMGR